MTTTMHHDKLKLIIRDDHEETYHQFSYDDINELISFVRDYCWGRPLLDYDNGNNLIQIVFININNIDVPIYDGNVTALGERIRNLFEIEDFISEGDMVL